VLLMNHSNDYLLARTSSGTLRTGTDSAGLWFAGDLMVGDGLSDSVINRIIRRDFSKCSFAFTINEDDWRYLDDGTYERTILRIGMVIDVSVVTSPAYLTTSVNLVKPARQAPAPVPARDILQPQSPEPTPRQGISIDQMTPDEFVAYDADDSYREWQLSQLPVTPRRQAQINAGYKKAGRILDRFKLQAAKI